MQYLIVKYLITAGVVVLVSEFAKRSDKLSLLACVVLTIVVFFLFALLVRQFGVELL